MGERLNDKSALITGGAGGIGQATAELFCAEGARVALMDLDAAALEAVVARLAGMHPHATVVAVPGDIAEESDVTRAVGEAAATLGGLDVLVNNAAARAHHRIGDAPSQSWQRILSVNIVGTATCSRAALPHLRRARAPSIVNVSSCFGVVGRQGMGQYDATKAAILSLTRTLACEEAANGVRVNAVCPGSTLTPFTLGRAADRGMSEADLRARGAVPSLLGRWAEPIEVAYPILWLASHEASFVTGAILMVDGGVSAM